MGTAKAAGKASGHPQIFWKGIGFAVFDIVGTGIAALLLLLLVVAGPYAIIFMIPCLAYAAPSLLLWGVVLLRLYLRERREPEGEEKSEKCIIMAIIYFVLGALGVWAAFYISSTSSNGPPDL